MLHLHTVPLDQGDAIAAANRVHTLVCANQLAEDAERFTDTVRAAHADLDGSDLVALRDRLTETADSIAEARRQVDQAGHDWIAANGQRGRADIDGVTYRASTVGSSTSLKVADKNRLRRAMFERLAEWMIGDTDDEDFARMQRLWLSIVETQLGEAVDITPRSTVLAAGLDGVPVDPAKVAWRLDVRTFETPSTGAGPRPTFEKAPTTKEKPVAR